jgi:NAD(P)-dependent dehydrogenase (short-subunit alcohol dehydrogenase family)
MKARETMLLKNKNAIIYGAGGAVGSTIARAYAREGARLFLVGRTLAKVEAVARDIISDGGAAEAAQVDALDEQAIERHATEVVRKAGRLDISFNAVGVPADVVAKNGMQGVPFTEIALESFAIPVETYTRTNFLTARAAARRMIEAKSGVILMHTPEPGRISAPLLGGMGPAWAAVEALSRNLSAELASHGIRVVCLRTTGLPETHTIDIVYGIHANVLGISREQVRAFFEGMTHRKRSTTLAELGNAAVVIASELGSGWTGTVANLTGGMVD